MFTLIARGTEELQIPTLVSPAKSNRHDVIDMALLAHRFLAIGTLATL